MNMTDNFSENRSILSKPRGFGSNGESNIGSDLQKAAVAAVDGTDTSSEQPN